MFNKVNERSRKYIYKNHEIVFNDVTAVKVSKNSGTHYLELKCGKKIIVAPLWLAIELDMDEWNFTSSK